MPRSTKHDVTEPSPTEGRLRVGANFSVVTVSRGREVDGNTRRIRRRAQPIAALPWAEIDAFCILARRGTAGKQRTIWGVHAALTLLTWETAASSSPAQMAAHERLCWLIVTRTGLPLRILTALARDRTANL